MFIEFEDGVVVAVFIFNRILTTPLRSLGPVFNSKDLWIDLMGIVGLFLTNGLTASGLSLYLELK